MVEQVIKPRLGVIGIGSSSRKLRLGDAAAFSSLLRCAAKRTSPKRRKMRPMTGSEYSDCLSPRLPKAGQQRPKGVFLRATSPVSFSDRAWARGKATDFKAWSAVPNLWAGRRPVSIGACRLVLAFSVHPSLRCGSAAPLWIAFHRKTSRTETHYVPSRADNPRIAHRRGNPSW